MSLAEIGVEATQALLPIASFGVVTLISYGVTLLRKKITAIDNALLQSSLIMALNEAEKVTIDAIYSTNQLFVENIKKASADGKLTKEEALEAMSMAQQYFYNHISNQSLDILTLALGPIGLWLKDFIEAKLAEIKARK